MGDGQGRRGHGVKAGVEAVVEFRSAAVSIGVSSDIVK